MPYLDIVFHNVRSGGGKCISQVTSRAYYTEFPNSVTVCQTPVGVAYVPATQLGGGYASLGWGANIVGAQGGACGMFFCESSPYPYFQGSNYNANWSAAIAPPAPVIPLPPPVFPAVALNAAVPIGPGAPNAAPRPAAPKSIKNSFTPYVGNLQRCAFLEGYPDLAPLAGVPLAPVSGNWLVKSNPNCALQCIGTGDGTPPLYGAAPPGSDRYAIYFQATNRTYNGLGNPITGLFVHTQNTKGDPGTQLTALCTRFPNAIIFGDLNFDITNQFKFQSLDASINGTHTILAIQQAGGLLYYKTHKLKVSWSSCLDYALVPNAFMGNVELWARQAGVLPVLYPHNSDHSVMMLRIHCN